jgi:TonB-linked SusC/RagA family outer membrane protein
MKIYVTEGEGICPNFRKLFLKMKLTAFFVILIVFQTFAESTLAQGKFSLDFKNKTIEQVLLEVENQSDIGFIYNKDLVDVDRKVNIDVKDASIDKILNQLFPDDDVTFHRVNNQIVISPKFNTVQQQKTISGKVIDDTGEPLPGVTVVIKGTTSGTVTNIDGNYLIADIPEDATLIFSFVGMLTQEFQVASQATINVTMKADAIGLEEVIAIGYGIQKKENVTGSVASIKSNELTVAPASNVTSMLAGRLSGLVVDQNSGRPGGDEADLFVRGFGANNGSTRAQQDESPLVVVDGFIREFTQLDPNEIESVTILKDASAAVYGVRSSAGVILVTTKRGKVGKPEITYNGSYSLSANTTFPEYANYLSYKKIWENRRDGGDAAAMITPESGYITTERYEALESGANPGTDWWTETTRPYAPMENHNLNIRGGTDKTKYFVSLGYLDQGTLWETNDEDYQRFNITVNLDTKINKNLESSFNLGWRRENREAVNSGGDLMTMGFAHPAMPIDIPGGFYPIVNPANPWSPVVSTNREIGGYRDTQKDVLNGSLGLTYKVSQIKGLTLSVKGSLLQQFNAYKDLNKPFSLFAYGDNGYIEQKVTDLVGLVEYTQRSSRLTTQASANYSIKLGDHQIDALLLGEWMEESNESYTVSANILTPSVPYLETADPSSLSVASGATEYGRVGMVGRLNYNYQEKYLLELSCRRDQSAYFPEETRVGLFPGVSVGWVISKEGFFENVDFVNRLKMRASVARLGNDQANGYEYIEGFAVLPVSNSDAGNAVYNGYVFDGTYQSAIRSTGTPNLSIGWQQADLYNVGLEMLFMDNKLGFELEGFYRRRFDLLELDSDNVNLPSTVGSDEPLRNVESLTNRGVESIITYREKIGKVGFSIRGNIAWAREKYDVNLEPETYDDPDLDRINILSGKWLNRSFGYQFDGFFKDQAEIDALELDYFNAQNSQLVPGDVKVKDTNNDGVIDTRDRVVIGKSTVPELSFGLSTELTWKNFDLTMFWQGASGFNQTITGEERGLSIPVNGPRTPFEYITNRIWTSENLGEGAEFPVDLLGITNELALDKYTLDCTYVRLKNLVVGYNLPNFIANKIGATRVRVYMGGTNLLTFDKLGFYPFDPESGGRTVYPNQKTYTMGINLTF